MPRELFIDASAWIALLMNDDNYHSKAVQEFPLLFVNYQQFVTTNLVIAEAYVFLRTRISLNAALDFLERVRTSPRLRRVYSDAELELEAEGILRQFDDQDFSLADAVSFVVMRQQAIQDAFTFDHHFDTLGFHRIPQ